MVTSCVSAVLEMEIESRMMSMTFGGGDPGCAAYLPYHGRGSCLLVYLGMVICILNGFGDEVGRRMGLLNADVGGEGSAKVTQIRVVYPMPVMATFAGYRPSSDRLLVERMSLCLSAGHAIAQVSETFDGPLDCCLHHAQNRDLHARGANCRYASHIRPFHARLAHGFGWSPCLVHADYRFRVCASLLQQPSRPRPGVFLSAGDQHWTTGQCKLYLFLYKLQLLGLK